MSRITENLIFDRLKTAFLEFIYRLQTDVSARLVAS